MATNEPAEPQLSNPGWLRRLWPAMASRLGAGLKALLSSRSLFVLGAGLVVLFLSGLIDIPFWPFTTTGKIYVDSPEVYTRERLVNDRYDQDYWLRQQLKALDDPEHLHLAAGREWTSGRGGIGDRDPTQPADGSAKTDHVERLSFEQEFRIVAGIRDAIRQQVLENMLDDRHDLTGNSVYGLKFDTTVIPGTHTRRRAFVHVQLSVDDLFEEGTAHSDKLPDHIRGYIASRGLAPAGQEDDAELKRLARRYDAQYGYYLTWLKDIEKRLNRMEDSVFESMEDCPTKGGQSFYDELTRRTLEIVLGVPQEVFYRFNESSLTDPYSAPNPGQPSPIRLQNPWAKFFSIGRKPFAFPGERSCRYRVWFELNEIGERFTALPGADPKQDQGQAGDTKAQASETAAPGATQPERSDASANRVLSVDDDGAPKDETPFQIGWSRESRWKLWIDGREDERRTALFGDNAYQLRYWPTSATVAELLELKQRRCDQGREPAPCAAADRKEIDVPSGVFNFIEHLNALDAYSYAMFPKNDVVGVFAQTAAQLSAAKAGAGFLDFARHTSEGRTSSALLGYGDGGGGGPHTEKRVAAADRSIAFGWVVSSRGDMEPLQKSQLALVSVPAWTNKLHLHVSVGWLDREANPVLDEDEAFTVDISVPPDYETFDSLFREDAWVSRGPRIQDDEMDKAIYVKAGEGTKILVLGSRLWRSASVTLGAQMAERIRVLPNMGGIVAEFGEVDLPYAAYNPDGGKLSNAGDKDVLGLESGKCQKLGGLIGRPVRLRVWTSEGVAKAHGYVCVMYDPTATGSTQAASRK